MAVHFRPVSTVNLINYIQNRHVKTMRLRIHGLRINPKSEQARGPDQRKQKKI